MQPKTEESRAVNTYVGKNKNPDGAPPARPSDDASEAQWIEYIRECQEGRHPIVSPPQHIIRLMNDMPRRPRNR